MAATLHLLAEFLRNFMLGLLAWTVILLLQTGSVGLAVALLVIPADIAYLLY
ncbi:MAG: hypothetical protein WCE68_07085 [Anaerolineales bacterium]